MPAQEGPERTTRRPGEVWGTRSGYSGESRETIGDKGADMKARATSAMVGWVSGGRGS